MHCVLSLDFATQTKLRSPKYCHQYRLDFTDAHWADYVLLPLGNPKTIIVDPNYSQGPIVRIEKNVFSKSLIW